MTWTVEPLPLHGPVFEAAVRVYGEAFAEPPYCDPGRGEEIHDRLRDVHSKRRAFRALVARAEDGSVIGMTYGYHGGSGQFWHDSVAHALDPARREAWLADSYELVELAVAPAHQSQGVGSSLIATLIDGLAERTCVLSTRCDSRAHQLYRRHGFEVIVEMPFAPGGSLFYVMGKRLQ